MVTIAQLKKQIANEKKRVAKQRGKVLAIQEKKKLELQLRDLKSPSRLKIKANLKTIGKGLKNLGKVVGKKTLEQAQLIKAQQIRENREAKKRQSKRSKRTKKAIRDVSNPFGLTDF